MARNTITGRKGNVKVGSNVLPITGWTAKGTKELADATDSANFDATSGQLWKSQAPGAVAMEGTIEGNFDLNSTDASVIQLLKQDPPVQILFGLTDTVNYAQGSFDLSDVETKLTVPGGTMVTYSGNFKSNGPVTIF
jgi:hypothetical protein